MERSFETKQSNTFITGDTERCPRSQQEQVIEPGSEQGLMNPLRMEHKPYPQRGSWLLNTTQGHCQPSAWAQFQLRTSNSAPSCNWQRLTILLNKIYQASVLVFILTSCSVTTATSSKQGHLLSFSEKRMTECPASPGTRERSLKPWMVSALEGKSEGLPSKSSLHTSLSRLCKTFIWQYYSAIFIKAKRLELCQVFAWRERVPFGGFFRSPSLFRTHRENFILHMTDCELHA